MTLNRLKSIALALSFGLLSVCAQNALAIDCAALLGKAIKTTSRILHLGPKEIPIDYTADYLPEAYADLSLSDRFIQTYQRIQSRNHSTMRSVFFYDYELKDVIAKMSEILIDAKDFSQAQTTDGKRHHQAYLQIMADLALYKTQKRIPYGAFHETTLQFAAFQKKGLKSTPPYKLSPQGRYTAKGHDFMHQMTKNRIKTSGFEDMDYELGWQQKRSKLLRKSPDAIFIPTFEELDEDFFNGISSYPVFPAGMTTNPNTIVDGQLFGSFLFLLHDFYHAEKSLGSISYLPGDINARENRRFAFNQAVATVADPELNRTIRVIFHYLTHEEHLLFTGKTIVISRSKEVVSALMLDAPRLGSEYNMFEEIEMRIYRRPHDFGEMFGDNPPPIETLYDARAWVSNFFRADTYYP